MFPLPTILSVHGDHDHWKFNDEVQHFANRGYAVLYNVTIMILLVSNDAGKVD